MEDYIQILEDVTDIRKADRYKPLNQLELKQYRKMMGKIAWLANCTRPDLSFTALQLAKKNNSATISNLRYLNNVLKKVCQKKSRICFSKLGKREDLKIIGISNVSYNSDDKSVGGIFLFLTNREMTLASPLFWK